MSVEWPDVMSWDEFCFNKGKLGFVVQNYETNELLFIIKPSTHRIFLLEILFASLILSVSMERSFVQLNPL